MFRQHMSVTELSRQGVSDEKKTVVICAEWRGRHGKEKKSVALFFGDLLPAKAGEERREKWVFLPGSQVESVGHNRFSIPEWLAQREGLLEYVEEGK